MEAYLRKEVDYMLGMDYEKYLSAKTIEKVKKEVGIDDYENILWASDQVIAFNNGYSYDYNAFLLFEFTLRYDINENDIQDYAKNMGEPFYYNDEEEINKLFNTPYEVLIACNNKSYNLKDEYIKFDDYGHLISFNSNDFEKVYEKERVTQYLMDYHNEIEIIQLLKKYRRLIIEVAKELEKNGF